MFSVVIPTKNRPELVMYAIHSAIQQHEIDVEVLVIDNGDPTQSLESDCFRDVSQVRYFRTGGLSMADNWEFGLEKASGKHILFLEDRMVLRKDALKKIRRCLTDNGVDVAKWSSGILMQESPDKEKYPLKLHNCTGSVEIIESEKIKKWYGTSACEVEGVDETFVGRNLPIGTKSCFTREIAEKVKRSLGGRVIFPVAPDYSLGFALLGSVDRFAYIDEDLAVAHAQFLSNGRLFRQNNKAGVNKFVKETGREVFYNHVRLKDHSIMNIVFNDYERMRLKGINLYPLDRAKYYTYIYLEYWNARKKHGVEIYEPLSLWSEAVLEEEDNVQREIKVLLRQYGHYFVSSSIGYTINNKKANLMTRIKKIRKRINPNRAKSVVQRKYYPDIENYLKDEFDRSPDI